MSILDKIPSLAGNELFQKLAVIEDITALCKEDQEKYDDAIKVMRDYIAAYKGAIIEAKIEVAKNMLMENETVDKIARYTGLSEEELLRLRRNALIPRVLPWARSFCPFRACGGQKATTQTLEF